MADSITITNKYLYVYPDCPYQSICSDNGVKCESCANNPKRSYYRPVEPPYIPYVPYYPWYPATSPWYPAYTTSSTSYYESKGE